MKLMKNTLSKSILLISIIFIFLSGFIFLLYYNQTIFSYLWKNDNQFVYYLMLWLTNPSLYLIIDLLVYRKIINKDLFKSYDELKEKRSKLESKELERQLNSEYVKKVNRNKIIIKVVSLVLIVIANLFFTLYCQREYLYKESPFVYLVFGPYMSYFFVAEHIFFTLVSLPIMNVIINNIFKYRIKELKANKIILTCLIVLTLIVDSYVFLPIPAFKYYYEVNKEQNSDEIYTKFGHLIRGNSWWSNDEIVIYKRLNEKITATIPPVMPDDFWGMKVKDSYPYGFDWYNRDDEIMNYRLSPYLELEKLRTSNFCLLGRQDEVYTDNKKANYSIVKTTSPLRFTIHFNKEQYSLNKYDNKYNNFDIFGYDGDEKIIINY